MENKLGFYVYTQFVDYFQLISFNVNNAMFILQMHNKIVMFHSSKVAWSFTELLKIKKFSKIINKIKENKTLSICVVEFLRAFVTSEK